jgi:hypothetical protein
MTPLAVILVRRLDLGANGNQATLDKVILLHYIPIHAHQVTAIQGQCPRVHSHLRTL